MNNNDVLRSLRYVLDVREGALVDMAKLVGLDISLGQMAAYLKYDNEPGYAVCEHEVMSRLLNAMVIYKRGVDPMRSADEVESRVTNNLVCKKLRVAFQLKDFDVIELLAKSGLQMSRHEVGGLFRTKEHRNYRECGDQALRYMLKGLTRTTPANGCEPVRGMLQGNGPRPRDGSTAPASTKRGERRDSEASPRKDQRPEPGARYNSPRPSPFYRSEAPLREPVAKRVFEPNPDDRYKRKTPRIKAPSAQV